MKLLSIIAVLTLSFVIQGCSSFEKLSTWVAENDESMVLIRIATSETLFRGTTIGTALACQRASRGVKIISEARAILDNTVLSLPSLDSELQELITGAGLNPVTASILLDIASNAVEEHSKQVDIGAIPPDARVTLNSLVDAVGGVVEIALSGC